MTARPSPAITTAWQAALGAEYRAVFGYGLLGPRLGAARTGLARSSQVAHADLRDATSAALLAAGIAPQAPQADYALGAVGEDGAAVRLAILLEDGCAAHWRELYAVCAAGSGADARAARRGAQRALTASAVRATRWRVLADPAAATTPFPGI